MTHTAPTGGVSERNPSTEQICGSMFASFSPPLSGVDSKITATPAMTSDARAVHELTFLFNFSSFQFFKWSQNTYFFPRACHLVSGDIVGELVFGLRYS